MQTKGWRLGSWLGGSFRLRERNKYLKRAGQPQEAGMELSPVADGVTRSDKDAGEAWRAGKSITRVTQAGRVCGSQAISRLCIFIFKKIIKLLMRRDEKRTKHSG